MLGGESCYYLQFVDETTEAHRGQVSCLRSCTSLELVTGKGSMFAAYASELGKHHSATFSEYQHPHAQAQSSHYLLGTCHHSQDSQEPGDLLHTIWLWN